MIWKKSVNPFPSQSPDYREIWELAKSFSWSEPTESAKEPNLTAPLRMLTVKSLNDRDKSMVLKAAPAKKQICYKDQLVCLPGSGGGDPQEAEEARWGERESTRDEDQIWNALSCQTIGNP